MVPKQRFLICVSAFEIEVAVMELNNIAFEFASRDI